MPIDYNKYPPNWFTEIRPAVLERANNCCEHCGLENHSHVWSVPFDVRTVVDGKSRYKRKRIWFRVEADAIREASLVRDIKKVKVVLTIAHLDHDEENHNVELHRLAALCQICHIRYDADEKWERQLRKTRTK